MHISTDSKVRDAKKFAAGGMQIKAWGGIAKRFLVCIFAAITQGNAMVEDKAWNFRLISGGHSRHRGVAYPLGTKCKESARGSDTRVLPAVGSEKFAHLRRTAVLTPRLGGRSISRPPDMQDSPSGLDLTSDSGGGIWDWAWPEESRHGVQESVSVDDNGSGSGRGVSSVTNGGAREGRKYSEENRDLAMTRDSGFPVPGLVASGESGGGDSSGGDRDHGDAGKHDVALDKAAGIVHSYLEQCTVPVTRGPSEVQKWLSVDPLATCPRLYQQQFNVVRSLEGVKLSHATREALRYFTSDPHQPENISELMLFLDGGGQRKKRGSVTPATWAVVIATVGVDGSRAFYGYIAGEVLGRDCPGWLGAEKLSSTEAEVAAQAYAALFVLSNPMQISSDTKITITYDNESAAGFARSILTAKVNPMLAAVVGSLWQIASMAWHIHWIHTLSHLGDPLN